MTIKKIMDILGTTIFCLWIASQFITCEKKAPRISERGISTWIENHWKDLKKKNLISGAILIQKGNKILFKDGDQNKAYAISSMSKSFVGMKYFLLEENGLRLNIPVCNWLKNFCRETLNTITLEMLLNHHSGFGRDLSPGHFLKRTLNPDWRIHHIDTLSLSEKDLKHAPGQKFLYSNFGYLVLSRVLEVIENKTFDSIVDEISKESELHHTDVIKTGDILPVSLLLPFTEMQVFLNLETILYRSAGTGGIKSSTKDIVQWLKYLQNKNIRKIFSNETDYYRHGLVKSQKQSYQAFWHNGASMGAYSLMAIIPKEDLRIVILTDNIKFNKQWSQEIDQIEQLFY